MIKLKFLFIVLVCLFSIKCTQKTEKIRISVLVTKSDSVATLAKSELNAGKAFSDIVKKYSMGPNIENGGDLGYFEVDEIKEELRFYVKDLKLNQISDVIKSDDNYYIVKKTDEKVLTNETDFVKFKEFSVLIVPTLGILLLIFFIFYFYKKRKAYKETTSELLPEKKYIFDYKSNNPNYNYLLSKFEGEQNLLFGVFAGFCASLISASIWAAIVAISKYEIGFMALAVGMFVAYSVRFFGKGISNLYRYIGSFFSLVGCLLGSLLSIVVLTSFTFDVSIISVIEKYEYYDIIGLYIEKFSPIDIVFFVLAIGQGYKFSLRQLTKEEIAILHQK